MEKFWVLAGLLHTLIELVLLFIDVAPLDINADQKNVRHYKDAIASLCSNTRSNMVTHIDGLTKDFKTKPMSTEQQYKTDWLVILIDWQFKENPWSDGLPQAVHYVYAQCHYFQLSVKSFCPCCWGTKMHAFKQAEAEWHADGNIYYQIRETNWEIIQQAHQIWEETHQ